LNEAARRALDQIANNRNTRKFEKHLAKSAELLRDAVGATNDRAYEANERIKEIDARVREKKIARTATDEEAVEYAGQLTDEVARVTGELEAALRRNIDCRAELEDEIAVLRAVQDGVLRESETWRPTPVVSRKRKAKRRQRMDSDDEEDDNEEAGEEQEDSEMAGADNNPPLHGVNNLLERARQTKAEEWSRTDMYRKYASNNDYITFKRTMHDAQNPDDSRPLPHATAWFGPDGQPVLPKVGEVAVDDGEEELQITGGKLDTRCPLSMTELTEPYTSKRCKHSFQKDAILEFIRMWRPGVQGNRCMCPVVGCDKVSGMNQKVSRSLLTMLQEIKKEDLYHDKVLLRRIERQRAADEQDERSSDEEEEATLVDGNGVVPKTSPKTAVKRERRQDDDMED
jgi:hypothetical protein